MEISKAYNIRTFIDADYATDKSDRKSVSKRVDIIYRAAVSCGSLKQKLVSRSTIQSEYLALSDGVSHSLWIQKVVNTLESTTKSRIALLFGDNRASI